MKRSLLLVMAMMLAAAAPALAQDGPDTPVSGRPGQGSATPSDYCEALQATGADIDCGAQVGSETGSEAQYADDAQYGGGSSGNGVSEDPGGGAGGARVLPGTGGAALLPLGAGALLIGSGLLCRRLVH